MFRKEFSLDDDKWRKHRIERAIEECCKDGFVSWESIEEAILDWAPIIQRNKEMESDKAMEKMERRKSITKLKVEPAGDIEGTATIKEIALSMKKHKPHKIRMPISQKEPDNKHWKMFEKLIKGKEQYKEMMKKNKYKSIHFLNPAPEYTFNFDEIYLNPDIPFVDVYIRVPVRKESVMKFMEFVMNMEYRKIYRLILEEA